MSNNDSDEEDILNLVAKEVKTTDNNSSFFQLFDNPLRKEFLTFDQVVAFFGRYGSKWVRQQMACGNLPYRTYGRDGILFYVPEVRQAILDGRLAPMRRNKSHDQNEKKEKGNILRSSSSIQGAKTLKELRELARSQ